MFSLRMGTDCHELFAQRTKKKAHASGNGIIEKSSGERTIMKILLYGMQSSGASTICLLLAQKPNWLGFIDVWSMFAAPTIPAGQDAVAKVVATTGFPLALHKERFQPDATFLVLRHPFDLVSSLERKAYANDDGLMEEKL